MAVSLCCRRLQTYLRNHSYQHYSTGYVILLPEIGTNLPEHNPLLKDGLPDFSDITPEKCVNTLGKHLLDFEHEVFNTETKLTNTDKDGKEEEDDYKSGFIYKVVKSLQKPGVTLETTWGLVKTIFIADSEKLPSGRYLSLHTRAHRAQYARFSSLPIFKASKECDLSQLSEEESRVVERYQLEGNLNGLGLNKSDKEIFTDIDTEIYVEKCNFTKRIRVSKSLFDLHVSDPYVVRGFPSSLLESMTGENKDPTLGPWTVPIDREVNDKFLEYCPDRRLRHKAWLNRVTIASLAVEATELQNSSCFEKIRDLRLQMAEVLRFPHYAAITMETKMAGNVENVFSVLENFRKHAFPAHQKEIEDLQEFANKSGYKEKLDIPDVAYWARKQKKILYNFENEELRDYFPFEKVFNGLLGFCEQRFGIRFEEVQSANTWHPDVKFFYVFEDDSLVPVAGFYFDPFARPQKLKSSSESGWVVNIRSAHHLDGPRSVPLSSVILNLPPPIYGKPSLLSYTEVQNLFSKFGRLLQQILSMVTYIEVSGVSFVEWDTVDVASHFMKYCLEEPKVLESVSGHYSTGEKLPVTDMRKVSTHLAGTWLCFDLFKSVFDLKMNIEKPFWRDIMNDMWPKYHAFPMHPDYNEPMSMNDIVTHECCATYCNIWSKMIAADAYSAFSDAGSDPAVVGTRFRDTYLAFGGSCDPHEVFRRFRGRDPSPDSFLCYLNLKKRDNVDNVK